VEGNKDAINCGDGGADAVYFNVGIDTHGNCELLHGEAP
jgi:hypothetical protein